jgi:hypothetical protein
MDDANNKVVEYTLRVTSIEFYQEICDRLMHKVFNDLLDVLPDDDKLKLSIKEVNNNE